MIDRLPGSPAIIAILFVMLATPALAGVPLGISIPTTKANAADFARFTKNTDILPRLVEIAANLGASPADMRLPAAEIGAIRAAGAVPVIAWTLPESALDETWIPSLTTLAREFRSDGSEIWMRLALPPGRDPADVGNYRTAFRTMSQIFRDADATNVRWMFVVDIGRTDGPEIPLGEDAFPGADVVDLIGLRGLNWGNTQTAPIHGWDSAWQSFREIFEHPRAKWRNRAPGKPIVAITATASTGGEKSEWVLDAAHTAASWDLAGLIWFQHKGTLDWAIQESIPREIMMEAQALNIPLAK